MMVFGLKKKKKGGEISPSQKLVSSCYSAFPGDGDPAARGKMQGGGRKERYGKARCPLAPLHCPLLRQHLGLILFPTHCYATFHGCTFKQTGYLGESMSDVNY